MFVSVGYFSRLFILSFGVYEGWFLIKQYMPTASKIAPATEPITIPAIAPPLKLWESLNG